MTRGSGRGGLVGSGSPAPRVVAGATPAVLAVHGFGGTPLEIELAVDVAARLGLAARAPLLPGHGKHAQHLARTGWADWSRSVEDALTELTATGDRVIAVGLSLGSLLATHAALRAPERVAGLVLLANAFWLRAPFPDWALWAVDRLRLPDVHLPKPSADIQDPIARGNHLTLSAQPSRAAAEVWRAGRRLRARLHQVRCPVLILHGSADRVCPVSNAHRVASRLGSSDVTVKTFDRSGHIVTRDHDRDAVARELEQFFRRLSGPQRPVEP
ncbi:MAG: alpha/beta fold hydrolase [Polyangiaceae bacterium]|nr:alpha/beta fold hydrolase [Polyangiaceae bacterium]